MNTQNNLIYVRIDKIFPHPDNPRKDLGDLQELADSIKSKGIMQNLTLVPRDGETYTVIIGHRRLSAARLAGLESVPCVITEMSARDQLATMLLENMQRSDLTVVEQAVGIQMMIDLGETVESVAEKTGFSKTTIRRRCEIAKLDKDALKNAIAQGRQITIGELDSLTQIEDVSERNKLIDKLGTSNFEYGLKVAIRKEKIAKMLPLVKKAVKDLGAKKMDKSDRYSSKFDRITQIKFYDWEPNTPIFDGKCPDKLFYLIDEDWGDLIFYKEVPKPVRIKKTPEQIAREEYIDKTWKELEALTIAAYERRCSFVEKTVARQGNWDIFLKAAVAIAVKATTGYYRVDSVKVDKIVGADKFTESEWKQKVKQRYDGIWAASSYDIPYLIHAAYGDNEKLAYHNGYLKAFPIHVERNELDMIYRWLEELGYELSDDERMLRDGTHPIFIDKDECQMTDDELEEE